jgi:potassium/hydrogen antiporter
VTDGQLILIAGTLLLAGFGAALVAERLRIPALTLFLGLGMLVGSDGTGWIQFGLNLGDYRLARLIGSVALLLILFEAGLASGYERLRPVLRPAVSLAVVGTAVTAAITGAGAALLFDLPILHGLLLGSALAASDGAAVFALLRGVRLKPRVAHTLEAEAGLNDPVAVALVVGLIAVITEPGAGAGHFVWILARELSVGLAAGALAAALSLLGARRLGAIPENLQLVASISTAALAFGLAGTLHGSGFLAVYITGLAWGGPQMRTGRSVRAFHEGLAAVAEFALFLALGLLVFPSQLGDIALKGLMLAAVVALVARPVAVLLATPLDGFRRSERILLGWAGLRGAVPVVLAAFPVIEGVPGSHDFFNIVFFAVLVSSLVQGTTVGPLARRLGLVA